MIDLANPFSGVSTEYLPEHLHSDLSLLFSEIFHAIEDGAGLRDSMRGVFSRLRGYCIAMPRPWLWPRRADRGAMTEQYAKGTFLYRAETGRLIGG